MSMGEPTRVKKIRDKFSGSKAGYCFIDFQPPSVSLVHAPLCGPLRTDRILRYIRSDTLLLEQEPSGPNGVANTWQRYLHPATPEEHPLPQRSSTKALLALGWRQEATGPY